MQLTDTESYVRSHMAPEKGASYDAMYLKDPWQRRLWKREQEILSHIIHRFYKGRQVRLLDFACGTGRIASVLEKQVQSATGVDVSDSMLSVAMSKLTGTRLIKANLIEDNVLAAERFNLITAFRFFPNAEPSLRKSALSVLTTLLSPDGCLVFNNHLNNQSLLYSWQRLAAWKSGAASPHVMSNSECLTLLRSEGLEIVRKYPVGLLYLPKVRFPSAFYSLVDKLTVSCNVLGGLSESPIFVCRFRSSERS